MPSWWCDCHAHWHSPNLHIDSKGESNLNSIDIITYIGPDLLTFTFSLLADAFIQRDLHLRTKPNK